jgi:isopentenyl phosphate kinase
MFFILLQVISIKDNDSLAARLAAEVQADLLILMSDVDGIYTCPPSEEGARLINTYSPQHAVSIQYGKKSRVGLGGMDSKVTQFYSTPKLSKLSKFNFLNHQKGAIGLLGAGKRHFGRHLQRNGRERCAQYHRRP